MNELDKLKQKIDEAQTKSLLASDNKEFIKLVVSVVSEYKNDLASLSKENMKVIKDSIAYLEDFHAKNVNSNDAKTKAMVGQFDAKIALLKDLIAKVKTIKPKDGIDGTNPDPEEVVPLVLAKLPKVEPVILDDRQKIVEKINTGDKKDLKIELQQIDGFDKLEKNISDRALSILDQRTQFLINKGVKHDSTLSGSGTDADPLKVIGGGGSGTPGGSNTQIQFNDAGSFGGDADFTWNKTTNTLNLTGSANIGIGTFSGLSSSSSNTIIGDWATNGDGTIFQIEDNNDTTYVTNTSRGTVFGINNAAPTYTLDVYSANNESLLNLVSAAGEAHARISGATIVTFAFNEVGDGDNAYIGFDSGGFYIQSFDRPLILNVDTLRINDSSLLGASDGYVWTLANAATGEGAWSPAGGGGVVMGPIGSSPNANGGTISSGILTLQPANGTYGGIVSTTTQTFAGSKTFAGAANDAVAFEITDGSNAYLTVNTQTTTSGISNFIFAGAGGTLASASNAQMIHIKVNPTLTAFTGNTNITGTGVSSNIGTLFAQPRLRFNTASSPTVTEASSVMISGAVQAQNTAAGNLTITNSYALNILGTAVNIAGGGTGIVTYGYGLKVHAPSGATNKYSAVFMDGNVGIGTMTPNSALSFSAGGINPLALVSGGISVTNSSGGEIASFLNNTTLDYAAFNVTRPGGAINVGDFQFNVLGPGYSTSGIFEASSVVAMTRSDFTAGMKIGTEAGKLSLFAGGLTAAKIGLTINTNQSIKLPLYGSGTYTGTPTYSLQVDSSGNVIEGTLGGSATLTATQIGFGDGSNLMTSNAGLIWDNTNKTFKITGGAATAAVAKIVNVNAGSRAYLQMGDASFTNDISVDSNYTTRFTMAGTDEIMALYQSGMTVRMKTGLAIGKGNVTTAPVEALDITGNVIINNNTVDGSNLMVSDTNRTLGGTAQTTAVKFLGSGATYNNLLHLDNNQATGRGGMVISNSGSGDWANQYMLLSMCGTTHSGNNFFPNIPSKTSDAGFASIFAGNGAQMTGMIIGNYTATPMYLGSGNLATMLVYSTQNSSGVNMYFGDLSTVPTARVHMKAGTATASTAPLKFTSGTNLTSAEIGAVEWDGTSLYFSPANSYRKTIVTTIVEANTAGSGAPNIITASESHSTFTNEGASALNYHTLPTAVAGLSYTFYVQDADGIRVVANTGDTIRVAGVVSGTAGYTESTNIGDSITLTSINATEWVAVSSIGSWLTI